MEPNDSDAHAGRVAILEDPRNVDGVIHRRQLLAFFCLAFYAEAVAPLPLAAGSARLPLYRFGVTPWQHGQSDDDIRSLYKPLLEWLGERVGAEFAIVGASGYGEMIDLLAYDSINLASISPVPFVLAKLRNPGVTMLVTELSWDFENNRKNPSYEGFIIARTDRDDIAGLETLRGSRFGFVRKQSSSGYVYPVAHFISNQIDFNTFFSRVYFLGSQPRVTDAVASGSIDAGATWDYNLKQAISKHGSIFKIVAKTGTIPNLGIAANSSVPSTMQLKIREALLEAEERLFHGLPAAGYVVKDDDYYDTVRDVVRLVSGASGLLGEDK
ncbi:MAG: phosphate/phosphite/phosphonate ABC transporter substrate-binding protein [Hyphomicrobiaceae bacterium]